MLIHAGRRVLHFDSLELIQIHAGRRVLLRLFGSSQIIMSREGALDRSSVIFPQLSYVADLIQNTLGFLHYRNGVE